MQENPTRLQNPESNRKLRSMSPMCCLYTILLCFFPC